MLFTTQYKNKRGGWVTDGASRSLLYEMSRRREYLLHGWSAVVFDLTGYFYQEKDLERGTADVFSRDLQRLHARKMRLGPMLDNIHEQREKRQWRKRKARFV